MNRRVLVTGGAGFIGSHIAAHLSSRDFDVHIVDRFSYAGRLRNLESIIGKVNIWAGDLKEQDVCDRLARAEFDAIVHTAANTHVDRAIESPVEFSMDNVVGTNRLLWALQRHSPETRAIIYSTDEVYGPTPPERRFDESAPFRPSNAYSASKVGVEGLVRSYVTTFGLPLIVVRPCNTYGRRQHPEKAIPKFVRQALRGEPLTVHGDGSGARDWLHTGDHATAIEILLEDGVPGEAYNLAAGDEHTDMEIARGVVSLTGSDSKIVFIEQRLGHDKRYWMDGSKLRGLGWSPRMPFSIGFRDTVLWNAENQNHWDADHISAAA